MNGGETFLPSSAISSNFSDSSIASMTAQQLINCVPACYDIEDVIERTRVLSLIEIRAAEVSAKDVIRRMISAYNRKDKELANSFKRETALQKSDIQLYTDDKGNATPVIDNFLEIMRQSEYYSGVRYNVLTNSPEIHSSGNVRPWTDADEARSQHFIETQYRIYNERKHHDALRIFFAERDYNPILDIVECLEWDGVERCSEFLIKWASVEDTPYSREVSRLIFAGGINRLYLPGCKFDDVPVLIGTNQGEGKSTLVRWLAIHDKYFSEITDMDGQKGIEQLEGAWICEIAELLALTKAKEQEAVKTYITRQRDKYRKPYDKQTTECPRRCVFIGTTNNARFLRDKTGNRRFYPVVVHSSGYWLYEHQDECREYILQCWAEARVKYGRGEMPNYADKRLLTEFKAAQDDAMEDDWRVGAIETYLDGKEPGDLVCVRQIKHEALSVNREFPQDPTQKESAEIGYIMGHFEDWERVPKTMRVKDYGVQRCWRKKGPAGADASSELPY